MENISSNRRFVCTGDLIADFYYYGDRLTLVDGGSSKFNCLLGLSYLGNSTAVISACTRSAIGDMLITGLKNQHVDTSDVFRAGNLSRIYHLIYENGGDFKSSKICPFCGRTTWYPNSFANLEYCLTKLRKSDILLFDNLRSEDIELIKNTPNNEKVIDLGNVNMLESISQTALFSVLRNNFEIIQLNERVEKYFKSQFKFTNALGIYSLFEPKVLIVTRGKKGAEVICNYRSYSQLLKNVVNDEVDTTGAGDSFFSTFISEYYSSGKKSPKFIKSAFELASTTTPIVVSSAGARGYIYPGFKPIKKPGFCTCEDFLSFT